MNSITTDSQEGPKVCELEIYDIPQPRYGFKDEEISSFREHVSKFRQAIWRFTDRVKRRLNPITGTYDKANQKLENVKSKTLDTVDYIQNDPGLLPRAGVITLAGLGGIIAGYKRSNLRRAFYSGSAMLVAASLCYPNQAVDISRDAFNSARDFAYKQYTGEAYQPSERSDAESSGLSSVLPKGFYDNFRTISDKLKGNTSPKPHEDIVIEQENISGNTHSEPEKDYGQSNEEDKDLYTTRD